MPAGKYLSREEKSKIEAWTDPRNPTRPSISQMALWLDRSRRVVQNFIRLGDKYGEKKPTKGNRKLTMRQKQQIIQEAIQNRCNSTEIRHNLQLPVTSQHVSAILRGSGKVTWTKDKKKPLLKAHHKVARLEFAKVHMAWSTEWDRVVFSDEKKFNLDGPDMCNFYWHGLTQPDDPKGSRNFGGGNVMIWGAFSSLGTATLCFVSNRMNSEAYTDVLEDALVPYLENLPDDSFIFQQDNASIHASRHTKDWFEARNLPVMVWPACSPDLNPIENLWSILARRVYGPASQRRVFNSIYDLKARITEEWMRIDQELLQSLCHSMPKRIFEVILKNGAATKY